VHWVWYDLLLASYCHLSVSLFVHCGTQGECSCWKLYHHVRWPALPIDFFGNFCCRMCHSATTNSKNQTAKIYGIALGSVITWAWLFQMQHFRQFGSSYTLWLTFLSTPMLFVSCCDVTCFLSFCEINHSWLSMLSDVAVGCGTSGCLQVVTNDGGRYHGNEWLFLLKSLHTLSLYMRGLFRKFVVYHSYPLTWPLTVSGLWRKSSIAEFCQLEDLGCQADLQQLKTGDT